MKQIFLTTAIVLFSLTMHAQLKFGALAGYTVSLNTQETTKISNESNYVVGQFISEGRSNSAFFGAFTQYEKGGLWSRVEANYGQYTEAFKAKNNSIIRSENEDFENKVKNIDFQVLAGLKYGVVRIGGGPVVHTTISNENSFEEINGYNAKKARKFNYGLAGNVGIDLGRFHIDARYVQDFNKIGESISFYNKSSKIKSSMHTVQLVFGVTL